MDMDGLSRSIAMALSGWCALPAACVFAGPGRSSTVSVRKSTLYPLETALSTAPYALPLEIGQAVAAWVGLRPPQIAALQVAEGMWLFHFWGELYGELLREILQLQHPTAESSAPVINVNEHCLYLPGIIHEPLDWNESATYRALYRLLPRFEAILDLGRFHSLLPPDLAQKTVVACCDLPRFRNLYCAAEIVAPAPPIQEKLEPLLT